MINEILSQAVTIAGFGSIYEQSDYSIFCNSSSGRRYAIFVNLTSLPSIDELHELVLSKVPVDICSEPAFRKNCDLIIVRKFDQLADYEKFEDVILSYEEDPYHFKKYFLYFTEAEEQLLQGRDFSALTDSLSDQAQFARYKSDPKLPSLYGIAARVFIKVPFLPLPQSEQELIPLSVQIGEAVENVGLSSTWLKVSESLTNDGIENFIEGIFNEELENIKNSDPGV